VENSKGVKKVRRRIASLFVVLVVAMALSAGAVLPALADDQPVYEPQIVGGTEVSNGKYRFVAALLDKRYGSTAYQRQFCGGSLIDRDSVLTAAHCVVGTSPGSLRVIVGRTALNSDQGQVREVSTKFVHPDYHGSRSNRYDAAVLNLRRPVSGITPIMLSASNHNSLEKAGRRATIAGWGNTSAQPAGGSAESSYPNRMRQAEVPMVSDAKAKNVYGRAFSRALMVAAGKVEKDTCQGDSGGPIFRQVSDGYRQIGITSFGAGCGDENYPGVYAEVNAPSMRNFIMNAASK
jgi:secreted trypsin-like serine protease